ncbi:hypothetical protein [Granulicella paludicola]|uniref:hypothetical protein n=1 Tax=Granulicella paludicola TaxID=474951 RepID=UPI0021E08464|nr:hypothetical protein [Granulicella paludicola]
MTSKLVTKTLYEVPVPSTGFLKEADWKDSSYCFVYAKKDTGEVRHVAIKFTRPMMILRTAESFCNLEQIEGSYDKLVEVEQSAWREKWFTPSAQKRSRATEVHHYMIYTDSVGCFETLAESWEVIDEPISRRGNE